jgi:ribosome biogenesis ATPase
VLYVPLPPPSGRVSILRALTRKTPLAADVDLEAVGTHPAAGDYSGADLAALVREACVLALKVHGSKGRLSRAAQFALT